MRSLCGPCVKANSLRGADFNFRIAQNYKKFPALLEAVRFIAAFTTVNRRNLSWDKQTHFTHSHSIYFISILIGISHSCLGLPNFFLSLSFFYKNPARIPLFQRMCHLGHFSSHPTESDHFIARWTHEKYYEGSWKNYRPL